MWTHANLKTSSFREGLWLLYKYNNSSAHLKVKTGERNNNSLLQYRALQHDYSFNMRLAGLQLFSSIMKGKQQKSLTTMAISTTWCTMGNLSIYLWNEQADDNFFYISPCILTWNKFR
uniref:Uncharacterized protein n=1 Tax=Anguilla anguilla TaxID=7936 RepID=A0A0E9X006_ANGAN